MTALTFLAATPEEVGRMTGGLFVIGLLLAGICKCLQIMRRPTTSTLCVLSLTLVLTGWMLSSAREAIWPDAPVIAIVGIRAASVLLILAALVIAIVGLVLYHQHPGRYVQGRAQAIWSLVICSLFLVGGVIGLAYLGLEQSGQLHEPIATSPGGTLRFADLNFELDDPGNGWVQMDAKSLAPDAALVLRRTRPEMYFLVIVEQGSLGGVGLDALVEVMQANIRSAATSVKISNEQEVRVGGVDGVEFTAMARVSGHQLVYLDWAGVHKGQYIQLMGWSGEGDQRAMEREIRRVREGFNLLDAERMFLGVDETPLELVEQPGFGYRLDLRNAGWRESDIRATDYPESATAGLWGSSGGMGVVAIPLDDRDPPLEDLWQAMETSFSLERGATAMSPVQPFRRGAARGQRQTFRNGEGDGEAIYQMAVLKRPGMAYWVTAWDLISTPMNQRQANNLLDRFEVVPLVGQPRYTDEAHRSGVAWVINRLGLAAWERHQFDDAAAWFGPAAELDARDPAYIANHADALLADGQLDEALRVAELANDRFPAEARISKLHADILHHAGRDEEAIQNYASLFENGHDSTDDLQAYVDLLAATGRLDAALAVATDFTERRPSTAAKLVLASVHRARQDWTAVIALLEPMAGERAAVDVLYPLADAYYQTDRSAESAALAQQLIDRGQADGWSHFLLGRAMFDLSRYREAKAAFEQCTRLAPADTDYRDWLAYASEMLGQGENWQVRTPIDPVPIPDAVAARFIGEDEWTPPAGYGAAYLHRVDITDHATGRPTRSTSYRRVKILGPAGIDPFTTLQLELDPAVERLHVNHVRVLDEQGTVLGETRLDDVYLLDDTRSGMATTAKLVNVPVPGLRPGVTIDMVWTRENFATSDALEFDRMSLISFFPSRVFAAAFTGEVADDQFMTFGDVERVSLPGGMAFMVSEPPVYRWEPMQPTARDFLPMVIHGDPNRSWTALAREYLDELKPYLTPNEAVMAQAQSVLAEAGASTDAEKVAALARFVQQRLSYTAIEFGVRGRIPNTPALSLQNAYGDCKDHAVLLHALLRAADVPASLVLIDIDEPLTPEFPSLDQFDHMIVFTPAVEGGRYIDTTDKHTPAVAAVPHSLGSKQVLVLDPDRPRLEHTPPAMTDTRSIAVDREVTIDADGQVACTDTLTLTGVEAGWVRGWLAEKPANERAAAVVEMLSDQGIAGIRVLGIDHLDDAQAPLVVRTAATAADPLHREGDRLIGRLPAPWERYYLDRPTTGDRRFPFQLADPLRLTSTLRLKLPAGYQLASAIEPAERDTPHVQWRVTGQLNELNLSLMRKAGVFPAGQYDAYQHELTAAATALRGPIVISR